MAETTSVAERRPTKEEMRILRHYADGQQIKHIAQIVTKDPEDVRTVVADWAGFERHRAKLLVAKFSREPELVTHDPSQEPPAAHRKSPPPQPEVETVPEPEAETVEPEPAPEPADEPAPAADTEPARWDDIVAAGLSYRQLDYWTRKGWLRSTNAGCGSGQQRHWPEQELQIAEMMHRLSKAGLKVDAAHNVARAGGVLELAPGVLVHANGAAAPSTAPLEELLLRAVKAGGEPGRAAGRIREQILALEHAIARHQQVAEARRRVDELEAELAKAREALALAAGTAPEGNAA